MKKMTKNKINGERNMEKKIKTNWDTKKMKKTMKKNNEDEGDEEESDE